MKTQIIRLSLILLTMTALAACTDDNIDSPGKFDTGLISEEDLYGAWSMDLDGNHAINAARLELAFSKEKVEKSASVLDIDESEIIEYSDTYNEWHIIKNFKGYQEYGYSGDAIHMENDNHSQDWLVKSVSNDSISLVAIADGLVVPVTIYRTNSAVDYAPPISKDNANIESLIDEIDKLGPMESGTFKGTDNSNWMSNVRDDIKMCHLAVPGTHDSGTFNIKHFAQFAATTQELSFKDQWKAGVRCFDLRVRNADKKARIFHGFIPCEMSFKDAALDILRLVAKSKESCYMIINTESNDWTKIQHEVVKCIVAYCTYTGIMFDNTELDEAATRKSIYEDICDAEKKVMSELGMKADDHIIIGYRPDLTLGEARGKLIVINRMSDKQGISEHHPFVGSEVRGGFSGVKDVFELRPNRNEGKMDTIVHKNAMDISDLYGLDDDEDHGEFLDRKLKEVQMFTLKGYQQRTMNINKDVLYFNSSSASFEDYIGPFNTHIPDYASVAESLYDKVNQTMKATRTCGLICMDYAGVAKHKRLSIFEIAAVLLPLIGPTFYPDPASKAVVLGAIELANQIKSAYDVHGDELTNTVLGMSTLNVPLDSIRISPRIISDAKPMSSYPLTLQFFPADATERGIESWSSRNTDVASISPDGEKATLSVNKYGNSIITAKASNGQHHSIYLVAPQGKMQPVDLGLSVLWADRNIGAALPECDGYFYSWGDIDEHLHNFVPAEYKYGPSFDAYYKYSAKDNLSSLSDNDDPARMVLGNGWRMPTKAEVEELLNLQNGVTWQLYERNGVKGYAVSHNGNAIFLPALGFMKGYNVCHDYPMEGYFWTRDIFKTAVWNWDQANCLYIRNSDSPAHGLINAQRYYGIPIRPVKNR